MAGISTRAEAEENMDLKRKLNRKKTQELVSTAQDIKFARLLAGNDKVASDRALRSLKKWFQQRCSSKIPLTEADLMVIWQGLFYSMWMSDKPLVQEECAERIALLIHSLDSQTAVLFFQSGLKTLGNQWYGIDQWRYDKFLMFVRRFLRQVFVFLRNNFWDIKLIKLFLGVLQLTIFSTDKSPPLSLVLHFCDIYMPELAKISEGQLNPNMLNEFLVPFVTALCNSTDQRLMNAIAENVFRYLMRQSNTGQEFEEKFQVWKKLGFPGGNINSLQKAKDDDDEEIIESDEESDDDEVFINDKQSDSDIIEDSDEEQTALDPRAGRVNVVLPQIQFSCKNVIAILEKFKFQAKNTKARSLFKKLIQELSDLKSGEFPLGMKKVEILKNEDPINIKKSANKLVKFENQLYGRNKTQINNKKRKKEVENTFEDEENEEGDQEVPIMKKPKLEVSKKKEKQKDSKQKQKLQLLQEKQKKLREIYEEKQKKLQAKGIEKDKQKKITTDKETKQQLEQQIRKTLKTSKTLKQQKEELIQKNRKLQSKKQKLESEVTKAKEVSTKQVKSSECFVRNSGTWHVYDPETESESETDPDYEPLGKSPKSKSNGIITTSPKTKLKVTTSSKTKLKVTTPEKKQISPKGKSPKETLTPSPNKKKSTPSISSLKSISPSSLSLHTSTPLKSPEVKTSIVSTSQASNVSSPTSRRSIVSTPTKDLNLSTSKQRSIVSSPNQRLNFSPSNQRSIVSSPTSRRSIVSPSNQRLNLSPSNQPSNVSSPTSRRSIVSSAPSSQPSIVSTPSPSSKQLFQANEWDDDLQDGEVEFFVPSKKYWEKRKSLGTPIEKSKSSGILKGKGRSRRKSAPITNLNSSSSSTSSSKKVKIDLRMNQSQEIHEHHAQIKSSPGIPFDANKKPSRPVIKANVLPSPINPFYKKNVRMSLGF